MTETKIHCDHCGKELPAWAEHSGMCIDTARETLTPDLCSECREELWDLVRRYCKTALPYVK